MSIWRAVGTRLCRNYIWLFLLIAVSWFVHTAALSPAGPSLWHAFIHSFGAGQWGGVGLLAVTVIFYLGIFGFWIYSNRWEEREGPIHKRIQGQDNWLV
jgi:uncharacterized membrane protein